MIEQHNKCTWPVARQLVANHSARHKHNFPFVGRAQRCVRGSEFHSQVPVICKAKFQLVLPLFDRLSIYSLTPCLPRWPLTGGEASNRDFSAAQTESHTDAHYTTIRYNIEYYALSKRLQSIQYTRQYTIYMTTLWGFTPTCRVPDLLHLTSPSPEKNTTRTQHYWTQLNILHFASLQNTASLFGTLLQDQVGYENIWNEYI